MDRVRSGRSPRGDRRAAASRSGAARSDAVKVERLPGVQRSAALAPYTTFKVGGPADWLVHAHCAADVRAALSAARADGIPVTLLGGASNVLVSDAGVRGLVVRMHGGDVHAVSE